MNSSDPAAKPAGLPHRRFNAAVTTAHSSMPPDAPRVQNVGHYDHSLSSTKGGPRGPLLNKGQR